MIVLAIRTDKPQAELYLLDIKSRNAAVGAPTVTSALADIKWAAHRQLAETLNSKISKLLMLQGLSLQQLDGIVFFQGPGSFTGLRIGASVANSLAYSLQIPIVGSQGGGWLKKGLAKIAKGTDQQIVIPRYGGKINITRPKK